MNSPRFEQSMDNLTNSSNFDAIAQVENNSDISISKENNSQSEGVLEQINENSQANASESTINEVTNDVIKVFWRIIFSISIKGGKFK